jgi:hypothetical protein
MAVRSGWTNKNQQRQVEQITSTLQRTVQVGKMQAVTLSDLSVTSSLKTRGAQISFNVLSLQAVDSFVLLRNFSRDSGSAVAIHTWPAASLKTTPQTYPVALRYADADPAISGKVVYYWVKTVPVSNATSSNVLLSDPQQFDASNLPTAAQITGDFAITQSYTPTTQPLTAVTGAGANQATVNIAAFQIQYPFRTDAYPDGLIPYNSGSITPLDDSTTYYIFFDDPTYAGGAQTFIADTNVADVTAGLHRQYCGVITTPAHGGGGTGGSGGGGGPCFTGNTRVQTKAGAKPIAEIEIGDEVRSLAGWVKVTNRLEHWYEGPMHAMGFGEYVTPEHRLWNVWEVSWTPAKRLFADSVPFKGKVYNLHCDGKDDFERCYRLLNGTVAHNVYKNVP